MDLIEAIKNTSIENIKKLIKLSHDINYKDSIGRTALHWAIYFGQFEIVKSLLEAGADINIETNGGYTAIDYINQLGNRVHIENYLKFHSRIRS